MALDSYQSYFSFELSSLFGDEQIGLSSQLRRSCFTGNLAKYSGVTKFWMASHKPTHPESKSKNSRSKTEVPPNLES